MPYYHVAPLTDLVQLQVAIDQEVSLRDAAGNPTPTQQMVNVPGRGLIPAFEIGAYNCVNMPGAHYPIVEGDDGTVAMMLSDVPVVSDNLGKTLKAGKALPKLKDLVRVLTEADHDKLPAGVMRKLDKVFVQRLLEVTEPDPEDARKTKRKLLATLADVDDPSKLPTELRTTLLDVVGKLKGPRAKVALQALKDDIAQDAMAAAVGIGKKS